MPDEDELWERIFGACDLLDGRLSRLEAELGPPIPAALSDTATSTAEPVQGAQGAELEKALSEGFSDSWRY
jgi:hypothetical protein